MNYVPKNEYLFVEGQDSLGNYEMLALNHETNNSYTHTYTVKL